MQGGPASFVRALSRILSPHYAISISTRSNLSDTLRSNLSNYGAIILNSSNFFPLLLLAKHLIIQSAAKTILIMHGEMGKELPYGFKKLVLFLANKIFLRKVDHIVFLSRMFMEDFIEKHGEIYRRKCVVIPFGIDPLPACEKPRTGWQHIKVVYVGGGRTEKGRDLVDELLADQTLRLDTPIALTILRAAEDKDYRTGDKISVSERKTLPERDFLSTLAETDIYLSVSRYETFGIALLQAYFSGCKLVAFEKAGALENLTDQRNIYKFSNHNYQDFRSAFCRAVASNSCGRPDMALDTFSFQRMAERYRELIDEKHD